MHHTDCVCGTILFPLCPTHTDTSLSQLALPGVESTCAITLIKHVITLPQKPASYWVWWQRPISKYCIKRQSTTFSNNWHDWLTSSIQIYLQLFDLQLCCVSCYPTMPWYTVYDWLTSHRNEQQHTAFSTSLSWPTLYIKPTLHVQTEPVSFISHIY